MSSLPPLSDALDLRNVPALRKALGVLFEPSPALDEQLTLEMHGRLQAVRPSTYNEFVDSAAEQVGKWTWQEKEAFLGGHPLIGEVSGLSEMSEREQGQRRTRPVVLERLAHLNALYSRRYPGLPYITFVAGRPRDAIVTEIEERLGIEPSPVPLPDDQSCSDAIRNKPSLNEIEPLRRYGPEWKRECERALGDIWRIAKDRLEKLGVE